MGQQQGPISRLPEERERRLVSCVITVLAELPAGRKRYIPQAVTFDQMQDRFGEVVLENRAEWAQNLAKRCASIALA